MASESDAKDTVGTTSASSGGGGASGPAPARGRLGVDLGALDRRLVLACFLLVGFCAVFYGARWIGAGRAMSFLVWNLFLAAIPVVFAYLARRKSHGTWFFLFAGVWLVFFPNAPYIVTDLMHIRTARPANLWLDVLALGAAALTGLFAGLVSLRWMQEALLRRGTKPALGWAFALFASLLAGFGVYLGRFQRWNSWDIVTRPTELLAEAWSALAETHVLAFSLLFSLVVFGGHLAVCALVGRPTIGRSGGRSGGPLGGTSGGAPAREPDPGGAPRALSDGDRSL